MTQDQVKNSIENIFNRYKFTPEQRSKALEDLIQTGESLVIDKLSNEMASDQKVQLESIIASEANPEDKAKNMYAFIAQAVGPEKINEVRNSTYDALVSEYIKHMSA